MRAIILAGGKGTRLQPYTTVIPKPLMPVGDYPILEIVIRQLVQQGFSHVTMAVNHQAELIRAFFGSGEKWHIKIDYSLEREPLGTMGPLRLLKDLPKSFLIMNGDVLTDMHFGKFLKNHQKSKTIMTVACTHRVSKIEYGVFEGNGKNEIKSFREKPVFDVCVNMGVYAADRDMLRFIPKDKPFGFDDLVTKLLGSDIRNPPRLNFHNGYWLDIGKPDDYTQAVEEFERIKSKFLS